MIRKTRIASVILAGGKASRMQHQDKPLLQLAGRPLIDYIVELAAPQVAKLTISVNHNLPDYSYLSLPLIGDRVNAYGGPLVGIYSAMCWLGEQSGSTAYSHIACFPGDVPVFPKDLVNKLALAIEQSGAQVALCKTEGELQPLFSLWSLAVQPVLARSIAENLCGPKLILSRLKTVEVPFEITSPADFANINTPADLLAMERYFAART